MKYLKRYNESLNESEIHSICEEYNIRDYTINEDGSIDVYGGVDLSRKGLTKLPLRFRDVRGDFDCSRNELTSLEGVPESVGGDFNCYNNKIKSLEGAPSVGGNFYCNDNKIISLDGLEFKSFRWINIGGNPIYKIVKEFIHINDTKKREELIEYFVDMGVIQG